MTGFPKVSAWWWLSLRRGFSSARPLAATSLFAALVIMALLLPISLVRAAVAVQMDGATTQLNSLRVDAPATSGSGVSTKDRDLIRALPGVLDVSLDLRATVSGADESAWAGTIQVLRPALLPPGVSSNVKLSGNQVIVPSRIDGFDLSGYVGKALPISYTRGTGAASGVLEKGELQVVAVYPEGWSGYGPDALLGSEEQVVKLYGAKYAQLPQEVLNQAVTSIWVQVDSESSLSSVMEAIRRAGFDVTAERDRLGSLPGLISVFPVLLTVVIGVVALVLVAQVAHVLRASLSHRRLEFGLLRIRGYSVTDLRRLLVLDVTSGVAVGALPGAILGTALGILLTNNLVPAQLRTASGSAVLSSLLPAGVVLLSLVLLAALLALLLTRRILRTDPFLLVMRD